MNGNEQIIQLLEQILIRLDTLTRKEVIPQISPQKNLSFLWDKINSNWTSFKPFQQQNVRLFGYHYESAPTSLEVLQEGWIPLRLDADSKIMMI